MISLHGNKDLFFSIAAEVGSHRFTLRKGYKNGAKYNHCRYLFSILNCDRMDVPDIYKQY
ncbi:hypothetical protein TUM4249_08810 [Shewanella sp. KT0246]|nr:hypothetical protein TUM4249_08810 [Shewanella sp. KT0246]